MLVIKNGLVHDMVKSTPYVASIVVEDQKIKEITTDEVSYDAKEIDASNLNVYPGFIDAHSHIGLAGTGIGFEGTDYNEINDIVCPQMRAIDAFNPFDPTLKEAALAGVTTVASGPGSANALGGTWIAVKTIGKCVDDMIVKNPVAMKCAFGENPKRCYRTKGNSARMSTSAHLREMLFKAKQYDAKKQAANGDITKMPPYDIKMEALLPVIHKEIPLKAHAHQANDILDAIRIAKEFDVKLTLEHVTEGHLIADILARYKDEYPMAVGPTLSHASKFELRNISWTTPGVLANLGCQVSIITDHPFALESYLPMYAGMAVKAGMKEYDALKAITINPAKHLGISDRVGSIEKGKDADLVVYEGSPLESTSNVKYVVINGNEI